MSFESLGLSEPILRGVAAAGYEHPTEIQSRAIPLAREGRDLIGLGQTGSGKTAAFGLPILERLLGGEPGLRAIVLVPTRELCVQVAENLRAYASFSELHVRTAFGGIPIAIQEAAFRRGLDVMVACPGRLIDHLTCGNIDVSRVEVLVLDEADRMLDMGFMPQIRRIVSRLPVRRQNWLFSATMPDEVEKFIRDSFGDTVRVQVGQRSQAAITITHRFETMRPAEKEPWLERLLRDRDGTVLIFVKTKKRAEELGRRLQRAGLPADSIHGDKSAESRHVVLQAFSRGKNRFMVATDVAARGIDVSDIGLVVNFDMPFQVDDYVHRVGRTGRAGSKGEAVSVVTKSDQDLMQQILRHLEKSSQGRARAVVDGRVVLRPADEAEAPAPAPARDGVAGDGQARRPRAERRERPTRERDDRARIEPPPRAERQPQRPRRAAQKEVALGRELTGAEPEAAGFGAGVGEARPARGEGRRGR
ncbi:MAG: DEAD/DEAH box helicase [Planctomycetes bacterium]|nr:DEAD/DEAH box helicase [Planctomycetota bacterium]